MVGTTKVKYFGGYMNPEGCLANEDKHSAG